MKKTHKVVMLPANKDKNQDWLKNKDCTIFLSNLSSKLNENLGQESKPQNLYILSDEEIKEGDWCVRIIEAFNDSRDNMIPLVMQNIKGVIGSVIGTDEYIKTNWRKIIATTDKSLQCTQDRFIKGYIGQLPQIPESFIQAYIKAYNEGRPITEVDLEYEVTKILEKYSKTSDKGYIYSLNKDGSFGPFSNPYKSVDKALSRGLIIHETIIKTRSDNTVIIHKSKTYSREEVEALLNDFNIDINRTSGGLGLGETSFQRWINQHL